MTGISELYQHRGFAGRGVLHRYGSLLNACLLDVVQPFYSFFFITQEENLAAFVTFENEIL